MIFKGEANTTIMKPDGTPRFKFDENGLFDTTVHAKEYEQTIIEKLKNAGFQEVVEHTPEVPEVPEVEESIPETVRTTSVKKK